MATPVDVGRVGDVTSSTWARPVEQSTFQTACLEDILDAQVPDWTAIAVIPRWAPAAPLP